MKFYYSKFSIFLSFFLMLAIGLLAYNFFRPLVNIEYVKVCDQKDKNCHVTNLPYQNSTLSTEERIADLLNRMTLAEKIGQMALVEKNSLGNLDDLAKYGLGAVLSGGGAKPEVNTPAGWQEMVNNFQSYSQKTRLSIPLLYGADANHGHGQVPGATIFPHFIGLGATNDPGLVHEVAKVTAAETAATGIYWIFSPNLDVVKDLRWGRTYETFGSDPQVVSKLGQAFIEGLQSYNKRGLTVAAGAKHYISNGSMVWGSSTNNDFFIDQGNSNISEAELRQIHLEPFRQAVNANVKSIMVGLNSWQGEKISASKYLISDILRGELGFTGLIFSDWYGVYEIERSKYNSLVRAINAGVDMIMLPYDYEDFVTYLQRAVANGDISQERINEATRRILTLKFELGLFDHPAIDSADLKIVGSKENRDLARRAVRKSLVLLKNNNAAVPISKNISKILVAGSAAHNLGKQAGGWTVEWQGIDGNWLPGTTILDGLKKSVSANVKVEYSLSGDFSAQNNLADVGIAVVGENPYAEGWGDNNNPSLSAEDLSAINNLKQKSKKIVVIIISGRPLNIKEYTKDWDAVIAAWLPGSEGQGVADVLFGDYPFTGTLPIDWDL